ncbi:serine carboxypeptidase [Phanerochaete sordida]|uniref:Carboxypeptidase n=1 Tax=Phanerochaete sordida TaxID=48140 RepID=A0A9P3GL26_9APHY|nr:serine carboxypeptidase [Phanerochaete sordida]
MKAFALIPLLFAPAALAVPAADLQTALGEFDLSGGILSGIAKGVEHAAEGLFSHGKAQVEKFVENGKQFVKQNGLVYELVTSPAFANYQLRVTDPDLCDPTVKQHSGYLDISDGKHLFFWFFESRKSPQKAPLTLWLNGGPGCSSSTGLLFELGPCSIADEGKNTTFNKYSWNTHSNMIFLDQPVNVGYSYSDDGSTVNTSPVAAEDVYAFVQLFLQRYPEYDSAPFHVAAESYGGTYAPNIVSVIHKQNKAVALRPVPDVKHVNLASVILANGITDPYTQMASVPDYACDGPYAVYDDPEGAQCQALRSKVPTCQRLIQSCYNFNSRWTCVPAQAYCYSQLYGPLQQLGLNLYDVRRKCDRSKDGDLCYKQMTWIDTWMNDPKHKKALGVNPDLDFASCNMEVNQAFFGQGDGMHNSAALLPELIEDGIRLLVYAGNADMMCNFMGNEAWVEKFENKFHDEFAQSVPAPWLTLDSGRKAGLVRSAGGDGFTAGNVTFVQVFEAGHMVPYDQPEAALDLFTRWITDVPLALNLTELAEAAPFGGW